MAPGIPASMEDYFSDNTVGRFDQRISQRLGNNAASPKQAVRSKSAIVSIEANAGNSRNQTPQSPEGINSSATAEGGLHPLTLGRHTTMKDRKAQKVFKVCGAIKTVCNTVSSLKEGRIPLEELNQALNRFIPPSITQDGLAEQGPFRDADIERISELLLHSGKPEWSRRPRTFALLRMIQCTEAIEGFIAEKLSDFYLPYTERNLPDAIKGSEARRRFLDLQYLVLTPRVGEIADLERDESSHKHFSQSADEYFTRIKELGSGGFGTVDHVWSKLSFDSFARKRIERWKSFKDSRTAIRSFENELATLKAVSHKHLVKLKGSYTDPLCVGLLMSPVADMDLKTYLVCDLEMKERQICVRRFFGCLGTALLHLHKNRLTHRDIKPGNILVKGTQVFLTDFGTSRFWSDDTESTSTGLPPFTKRYCSPEVAEFEKPNDSSDIWSLGCVFLEMLSFLNNRSIEEMQKFFLTHGTGFSNVRSNGSATEEWMNELKMGASPDDDVEPLDLIVSMTNKSRKDRPTAQQVVNKILSFESELPFYGLCCSRDDDTTRGSDLWPLQSHPEHSICQTPISATTEIESEDSLNCLGDDREEVSGQMTPATNEEATSEPAEPGPTGNSESLEQIHQLQPPIHGPSPYLNPLALSEVARHQRDSFLDLRNSSDISILLCQWPSCPTTAANGGVLQTFDCKEELESHYRSTHGTHEFSWSRILPPKTSPTASLSDDSLPPYNSAMVCSVPVSTSPCSGSERSLSDPPPPYTVLDDKTPADQPQTPSISSSPKRVRFSQVPGDTTSEASPSRSPSRGRQTDRLTFHVPEPLKEPPLGPASSVHLPIATSAPSYILAGTRRFAREDVEGFVNRPRQIHVPTAKPLFVYGTLMFPSILSAQARHSMQGNYSAQHQRRLYPESYDFAGANKSIQNATEIMTPAVLKGFDRWRPFGYDCAVVHQSEFTPQVIANGAAAGGAVPSRLLKGKVNGFLLFGITEEGLRCFDQLTSFKPSVTRGEERRQMRDFAGSIPIRSQGSPYLKFFEGVLLKRESVQVDISLEDGQTSSIEAVTYVWSGGSYGLKEPWNINKFVKTPSFGYWSLGSPNWVEEEEEIAKSLEISYVYPGDTLGNAALRENLEEVKTLLKQGDSVDAPCRNYGTALQISATLGNEEMARFLLKKGAKVDAEGGKYHSALVAATIRGHENLVTLLLDAKANALKPAGRYISPLYQAISHSDEEIVYLLLEAGAWLDKGYAELLDLAAERGNRNIIDLMRDYDVRDLHLKLPSHADAHNPRGFRRRALNRSSKEVTTTNKSAAVLRAVVSQWLILKGTPGDWKGMKGVRTLKAAIKAGAPITVVDGIEKNLTGISSLIDYFKYSLERSEGGSLRFADSNRSLRDGRSHHDSESSEDSSEEDGSSSDDSYRRRKDRRRKRKPHSSSSTFLDMRDNNMEKNGDPGQQSRGRSRRTNGASSKPPYGKRPCSACSCFGGRRGTGHSCPDCRGQGYFAEGRYNRADSKNVSSRDIRCHACYGSGKLFSERDRCRGCAGRGWK